MAGLLVIGLSFLYMLTYVSVTAPLEFTMLAVALLWRNDQWIRGAEGGELTPRVQRDWALNRSTWTPTVVPFTVPDRQPTRIRDGHSETWTD